ncbi:ATG8-interacting protein 2-like [Lolium rigidum]|uniref:ATG8-interacting protein 2-like n=1 Tax=Lolium rigidum TaxID=89674 RepID=UPI001F5E28CB|nr:ATG8-interacting protein 2-like [Lolium rigidum]
MADADNYSSGGGGGSGWEVVSLTASTYAAAPGPVPPLLLDSQTELSPPADAAAIFMSQHFNLPADAPLADLNGPREEEEPNPAMVDDEAAGTEDLNMQNERKTEMQDDSLTGSEFLSDGNGLQEGCGLVGSAVGERLSTILCPPDAAGSDIRPTTHHRAAADVNSASPPAAHVVTAVSLSSGAASDAAYKGPSSKIPCESHAWWNKTFSFLRSNSKQSLTFRFVFVAATIAGLAFPGQRDRLQLRLEFNVDTEKMSSAVRDPLGQVKLNMLVGGSPVAQG